MRKTSGRPITACGRMLLPSENAQGGIHRQRGFTIEARMRAVTMLLLCALLLCACGAEKTWDYTAEDISFMRDGLHIAGKLYLPEGEGPFPTVVLCHGYGANMQHLLHYGEFFASHGIAACAFDFIGGGENVESDGTMLEMSVLTEAADLNAVMDALLARPEIEGENLFLVGASQGGFIVTYVAAQRPEDVKALIPLYPGYGMQDFVRMTVPAGEEIPETVTMLNNTVSRMYVEDAMSFDIADCMRAYPGPVRIIHGTADIIAPILYSNRAAQTFPNAEVMPIEGANHGFRGEDDERAMQYMLEFVQANIG